MSQPHETIVPDPNNDPAEKWIQYDEQRKGDTAARSESVTDTSERIPVIPAEGPVDGVPESYAPRIPHGQDPVNQVPKFTRKTPLEDVQHGLKAPDTLAGLNSTPPKIPVSQPGIAPAPEAHKHWYDSKKVIASIGAGAVVLAGIAFGITKANSGSDKPDAKSPVATAPGNPGPAVLPGTGEAPSNNTPERPVVPGNISLGDSMYSSMTDLPEYPLSASWGRADSNQDIFVKVMSEPRETSPTVLAAQALNMIAASISGDLRYSPQIIEGLTGYPRQAGALHPVTQKLLDLNTAFHNSASAEDQGTSVEQLDIFDDAENPATFTIGGTNEKGFPYLTLSSGVLYVQRVVGGKWQDPANFDLTKATPIKNLSISFKASPVNGHATIEDFNIPDLIP